MTAPNYVQTVINAIKAELPDLNDYFAELYALLALTTGTATTLEHVHDAWSVLRNRDRPDHPSLVPFDELTPEIQEYDRKYQAAIHKVALGNKRNALLRDVRKSS